MTGRKIRLLLAMAAAVGLVLSAGGVAAGSELGVRGVATTKVAGAGELGALSFNYTCHGYMGTFKDGSSVAIVPWSTTGTECFGIAPDRTIWHAWSGSGGWKVMPGNGRADDTGDYWYENTATGARVAQVWVNGGTGYWCQNYTRSGGWAGRWYDC